jgi:hypothetical protein
MTMPTRLRPEHGACPVCALDPRSYVPAVRPGHYRCPRCDLEWSSIDPPRTVVGVEWLPMGRYYRQATGLKLPSASTPTPAALAWLKSHEHIWPKVFSDPNATYVLWVFGNRENRITCLRCGMTSAHDRDVLEAFCGNCHQFHAQMRAHEMNIRETYEHFPGLHKHAKPAARDVLGLGPRRFERPTRRERGLCLMGRHRRVSKSAALRAGGMHFEFWGKGSYTVEVAPCQAFVRVDYSMCEACGHIGPIA